jgi:hypothetical protein
MRRGSGGGGEWNVTEVAVQLAFRCEKVFLLPQREEISVLNFLSFTIQASKGDHIVDIPARGCRHTA